MRQADVATATGVSTSYVNQTMTGKKAASARWVTLVAEVTGASRRRLSNAAARDQGYDVGPEDEGRD